MKNKKTIVIFIGGYLPGEKYGGPVTSLENFANQMHDYYNIKIICSDHDFKDSERYKNISDGWNHVGNADVYYTNERSYNSKAFYEIIKPFKKEIELFYLSGIYYIQMNYAVIKMAKKLGIPVLLAPRGDLMKNTIAMKSKVKMVKKLVFLFVCRITRVFDCVFFQSTSDEETEGLHHYLKVSNNHIFQLPNLPVMKHKRQGYQKEDNHLKIVFISRLMVKKNPLLALEAVKGISEQFTVEFDLYGPKEDERYWNQCDKLIKEINDTKTNITVKYNGALAPAEAKRVYDNYDCFIFPTVSENYGHVIVEALFAGCPVIVSKGTTPFDDCDGKGSFIADLKSPLEFTKHLEKIAAMNQKEYQRLVELNDEYLEKKFQVNKLKKDYIHMIETIKKAYRGV